MQTSEYGTFLVDFRNHNSYLRNFVLLTLFVLFLLFYFLTCKFSYSVILLFFFFLVFEKMSFIY